MLDLMPNKILVKLLEQEDTGLIKLPETAKEKSVIAEIVAIGPCILQKSKSQEEYYVHDFNVKVGETVLMTKYAGFEINVDGSSLWLISEDDILGILE